MELANIFNVSLEVLLKGEYSDFAEQSSQTDIQQNNLSSTQNNNEKNINEQIIDSKQTQPKTESKYLVQHIISLCLGGVSIIASVIFPFLVNFVLALVGLILSKNPEKVQLGKIAKIVNIIAMIISIIAIAIVAIMILNQNIYPF